MSHFFFISAMESHPWGGSEELWFGAALRLTRMGHRVSCSIKAWPDSSTQSKVAELKNSGILVLERLPPSPPPFFRRALAKAGIHFSKPEDLTSSLLLHDRPDLICISNGNYADGLWALELAKTSESPYVSVVQANAEFLWPDDTQREKLEEVYSRAKAVYCVSDANLTLLKNQLACDLQNGSVVRNPFNVPYDVELKWSCPSDSLRLAIVARVEPDAKGHDILFQALKSKVLEGLPIRISIFGKGRSEKGTKKLAQMLGVANQVDFCGQVSNVANIWIDHHALVLPSRYEGLPLAIVEAMLCARPVITTNVSGNAELLVHGSTGFIADSTTPDSVANAIREAWERRSELEAMGKRARVDVLRQVPRDPCQEFANTLAELVKGN